MVVKVEKWGFLQGTWRGLSSKVNNPQTFPALPSSGCQLNLVLFHSAGTTVGLWGLLLSLYRGQPGLQFGGAVSGKL